MARPLIPQNACEHQCTFQHFLAKSLQLKNRDNFRAFTNLLDHLGFWFSNNSAQRIVQKKQKWNKPPYIKKIPKLLSIQPLLSFYQSTDVLSHTLDSYKKQINRNVQTFYQEECLCNAYNYIVFLFLFASFKGPEGQIVRNV